MSLEELITSLTREAGEERARILRTAAEEAERIRERAREESGRMRQGPQEEARRRLEAERARRLHNSRMGRESLIRKAKGEIIDEVARRVVEKAEKLAASSEWSDRLRGLIAEAAAGLPGGTVWVRPRDLETARKLAAGLPGSFRVQADGDLPPGVRITSEDGLVEVDNTVPIRLVRFLAIRETEVADLLFPVERHA